MARAANPGPHRQLERVAGSDCSGQRTGVSRPSPGCLERGTPCTSRVHPARQTGAERLRRKLQRSAARRMPECELVHEPARRKKKNRELAARLQSATPAQLIELRTALRICAEESGDAGMRGFL